MQPPEREPLSPSRCLHVLRAHGPKARFAHPTFPTGDAVLKLFLDTDSGKAHFGEPLVERVPTGLRYLARPRSGGSSGNDLEYHRDQTLAALAELRVPLSTALTVGGKPVPLREVLRDSVANFHLKQNELEWTALAYALLLPPHSEWVNRYGECYTFDELAAELLDRPLDGSSCGGTHLLYTLTIMARVDGEAAIFSEPVRQRVGHHLRQYLRLAVVTQQLDGSWPGDWFYNSELNPNKKGPSPASTPANRLVLTGHLAEWMLYLPPEFQPAAATALRRAGLWLLDHLKALSAEERTKQFCPCTHGICVLRQLSLVGKNRPVTTDRGTGP